MRQSEDIYVGEGYSSARCSHWPGNSKRGEDIECKPCSPGSFSCVHSKSLQGNKEINRDRNDVRN